MFLYHNFIFNIFCNCNIFLFFKVFADTFLFIILHRELTGTVGGFFLSRILKSIREYDNVVYYRLIVYNSQIRLICAVLGNRVNLFCSWS